MISLLALTLYALQASDDGEPQKLLSYAERMAALRALGVENPENEIARARRSMRYMYCLGGTSYPNSIAGLPDRREDRPAFLKDRRVACARDRLVSEQALMEAQSMLGTSRDEDELRASSRKQLDQIDVGFEENVLRPEIAQARTHALKQCLKTAKDETAC